MPRHHLCPAFRQIGPLSNPPRPRANPLPEDNLIRPAPPNSDRRTTDRTLYWLPLGFTAAFVAASAFSAVLATSGAVRTGSELLLLVALAFLAPAIGAGWATLVRWRESARISTWLADAREGDESPLGTLLARWSVTDEDVEAYLVARDWERQQVAVLLTGVAVLACGFSFERQVRHGHDLSSADLWWVGWAVVFVAGVWGTTALLGRAARARAESGPLAVIVCQDGVSFAGDLTWWRGPRRLVSAKLRDPRALALVSTYATYVPREEKRQWIALRGSRPTVQLVRQTLLLPVPLGDQAEAAATARALRERHGLPEDRLADDPFATR